MAKCLVAHPIACEGIAVTPGRDVVYASTAEEFANSIGRLFRDPSERRRIGAAARALAVERYSFASIGAGLSDLLEGIASGR
jgi:glycosyltransferase involved in cell wall biosynthesis